MRLSLAGGFRRQRCPLEQGSAGSRSYFSVRLWLHVRSLLFSFRSLSSIPVRLSRRRVTISSPGIGTLNAASTPCTTSAVLALGIRVSILKDWSLLSTEKGRRWLAKKDDSLPGSQSASTVMGSFPLARVRELVSRLADPKLPRFTHLFAHTAAWPFSSCRARPETWPTKVPGIGLLECSAGALHNFELILHVLQETL